jgi:hypothetical protein
MTLPTLFDNLARMLAQAPGLATAGPIVRRRDPTLPGLARNGARTLQSSMEHIMNNDASATTTAYPWDHARSAGRSHSGHRPRLTAGQRLAQALFDRAGPLARLVRHGETQWASATFTGSRHTFVLRFYGNEAVAAAEALALAISDCEFEIRAALIAEMTVTRFAQTLLPQPEAEIEVSALLLDQ